jgi:ferritin-like metal-binding protein YciE
MARAASNEQLKQAFNEHLEQTEEHVSRLEEALSALDVEPKAKTCHGMMGLIEEGSEQMQEDYDDDSLRDAAIIGAAQKVEHYEISAYGTARTLAQMLGNDHVVSLLESTLKEEKQADQKLTTLAESAVNPDAAATEEEGEEEHATVSGRGSANTRHATGTSRGRMGTSGRTRGR